MFDDHSPSEADLARWQNFDQLLFQYHQAQKAKINARRWWYGATILTILLLGGSVLYFYHSSPVDSSISVTPISSQPPITEDLVTNPLPSVQIKPVPEKKVSIVSNVQPSVSNTIEQKAISQFEEARPEAGYPALYEYFATELKYPEAARKEQAEGTVLVEFYINEEGKPDRIQVLQGVRGDIDQEATRLIKSMPNWLPAQVNGQPTTTKHTMPLTFQIDDEF